MRFAFFLCCLACLTAGGYAADTTWTGKGRAAIWDDPANWTPTLPGPLDTAYLPAEVSLTLNRAVTLGALSGAGTLTLSPQAELHVGESPHWRGRLVVAGTVHLDGAFGELDSATVHLGGGTVILAADQPNRDISAGQGGRIVTRNGPRQFRAVLGQGEAATGLMGTYLAGSRRDIPIEDDWRRPGLVGDVRRDPLIDFQTAAFGPESLRRAAGIGGSADDWEGFSVQWDGWIRIFSPDTQIATASDDGSRVWIDRNGDNLCQLNEWGSNGWGTGQGTTRVQVQSNLSPGLYRIRVQYEEGGGGNQMLLLWSDATKSAGAWDGWQVVPTAALIDQPPLRLGGDGLTLSAPATGSVIWEGPGALTCEQGLSAGSSLSISHGAVHVPAHGLNHVMATVERGATLNLSGEHALSRLTGDGMVTLHDARVAWSTVTPNDGVTSIIFQGTGTLANNGPFSLILPPDITQHAITCEPTGGPIRIGDHIHLALVHAAPLVTRAVLPSTLSGSRRVTITLTVPPGEAVGIGAWAGDTHGAWFQRLVPGLLAPGIHECTIDLDRHAVGEPLAARFTASEAATCARTGLVIWSNDPTPRTVAVIATVTALPQSTAARHRLLSATHGGALRTGERWSAHFVPDPMPSDPFDPSAFHATLVATAPDGSERRINAFWEEPQALRDAGDREDALRTGPGFFSARFRALIPGPHRLRLDATWADGGAVTWDLGTHEARGEPWAGFPQRDAHDPRFFSVGTAWWWPVGLNVRSPYDVRSRDTLGTTIGWNRGSIFYGETFDSLAAAGGDAAEVWLAGWNLGLEWNAAWKGFGGVGRYNQENAARLDRVLDLAWDRGIRLNLVVSNHGQGSEGSDPEWAFSPYHSANGGPIERAAGLFRDPKAFAYQERYRRYLAARYSDHPGLMGWKLWSEVQLTSAGDATRDWHEQATASWATVDPWNRPLTTHWASNWRAVDPAVATLPGIDYVTIDAYRGDGAAATLLSESLLRPTWAKGRPVLATEYGGDWSACPEPRMRADHASGAWVGLVSGHAGAPMLWWHEWVAQRGGWGPYGAIRRFIRDEDLRGADARSIGMVASGGTSLWSRAWMRPGRMLGYMCDLRWGADGGDGNEQRGVSVKVGDQVTAGGLRLEWWDADRGSIVSETMIEHAGGALAVAAPTFRRHLAFKLIRGGTKPAPRVDP